MPPRMTARQSSDCQNQTEPLALRSVFSAVGLEYSGDGLLMVIMPVAVWVGLDYVTDLREYAHSLFGGRVINALVASSGDFSANNT